MTSTNQAVAFDSGVASQPMNQQLESAETASADNAEAASLSDEELMARVCAGEKSAFSQLYDRYVPLVYALCLKILHRDSEAEAVVSDIFLEVWRKPANFDAARGTCRTYLLTLARSRAIDRWRASVTRAKKTQLASEESHRSTDGEGQFEPSLLAENSERREAVRAAVDQLDRPQREALHLAYFEGLTHREIAERLEMPLGSVKTRIRSGLKRLRLVLSALGESGGLR